jgi:hypothetical protein
MSHFIFAAAIVLAATKAKVQVKDTQTNKERKDDSDGEKIVARKAG